MAATSTEPPPSKTGSPFLTLFNRKKKIKSHDDLKASASPQLPDRSALTLSFPDRVQEKKSKSKHPPPSSSTLPAHGEKKGSKKYSKKMYGMKSQSIDVLCEEDPAILVEALETLAFEQPLVARSIPKHAKIMPKEDKSMKNCLFQQEVYDAMLSDSLKVCDLLQTHLDECIVSVRAKSPEPCLSLDTSQDGRDSGRGASSASSTMSTSPAQRALKSTVRSDV